MSTDHDCDVLVVGGGPVGLFSALMLARSGVDVILLEEQWRAASRSYALGLHPESLRILGRIDLAADLLGKGTSVEHFGLYGEGHKQAEIRVSKLPGDFPNVLVLPQHLLEHVLIEALEKAGGRLLWNHRLAGFEETPDGVVAKVERLTKESSGYSVTHTEWVTDKTLEMKAAFLVGADGHRSLIRRTLDIPFPTSGASNTFAVFEFSTVSPGESELEIVLEKNSTNVLWPLPDGRFRWSFELPDFEERPDPRVKSRLFVQVRDESYPHVTEDKLEELIADRAPWWRHRAVEVLWSAAVRFERRLAERFGRGRVWLAGDAAHLALPIGIQSMNIGFREASDLTSRIADVLKGKNPVESLQGYDDTWRKEWADLLRMSDQPLVASDASPWVRDRAGRIPPCIPASGDDLKALLGQVGLG
jgi:2-polyprenyl-6-methoxyphenol hydroxylase-like FAD-dependent oxidoreductase